MDTRILASIESHPVWAHPIFALLAQQRLPAPVLAEFLTEMGALCAASRPPGTMARVLSERGLVREARIIEGIFDSERGHADTFGQMARQLLAGTGFETQRWECLDKAATCAETQRAAELYAYRDSTDYRDALYSLGVLLPTEMVAHRQVIPGEVNAFVTSGHYGLQLQDVEYLLEHAGEHGAEQAHETGVMDILGTLALEPEDSELVLQGSKDFLDALQGFYDRLQTIITQT